jgi:O-antigen/teichoic acid export membrane protein
VLDLRRRTAGHHHLLQGSAVLVVGAGVQAITGSLFWLIAARQDTTDEVGRATALFTSVLFVSYVTGLGLPVALARYAGGRDRDSHVTFAWGALATAAAASVGSLAYLFLVDSKAVDDLRDWHGALGPLLFTVLVVGSSLSLIVDVRWMTVRRWNLVLTRIAIAGLLRLPLLLLPLHDRRSVWLFVLATGPTAVSGFLGLVLLPRVTGDRHSLAPRPAEARPAMRFALINYLSTLAYQAPSFILPVIVLINVDPDVNASFYVAWGITTVAFYVPTAIGQALLAEGGRDGAELRSQVRLAVVLALALMIGATICTELGRNVVTTVYGDDYGDAARILPALIGAGIPWVLSSLYLTEARVLHRHITTVAITATLTVAILVPAAILVPRDGLDGATTSFLIGNLLAGAVAFIAHLTTSEHARSGTLAGEVASPEPLAREGAAPFPP